MTLNELKLKLKASKTGTNVEQVIFDYDDYMNTLPKAYPLVLWNMNDMTGTKNRSKQEKIIEIDCYCIDLVQPEQDAGESKLTTWDSIEADLEAYLDNVNTQLDLSVENVLETPFEYYPAGLFSLDREMGVRYRITLKLWC